MRKMGQEMGEDFPGEVDQMVEEARMIKMPEEVELIKKASDLAVFGCRFASESAAKGMSEYDLARRVYDAMLAKGAAAAEAGKEKSGGAQNQPARH